MGKNTLKRKNLKPAFYSPINLGRVILDVALRILVVLE